MKEFVEKNKKKLMIVLGIVLIIIALVGFMFYKNNKGNPLQLKENEVKLEYKKDTLSLDATNYLDESVKEDIKNNTEVVFSGNMEDIKVGEYTLTLKYKDYESIVNVKVQDTTSPQLNIQNEVLEIKKGTNLSKYDFTKIKNFKIDATDYSTLKPIQFDTSKVNSSTLGEYEVKATVEDEYGNKTEKIFKVKIVEEVKETETNANNQSNANSTGGTSSTNKGNTSVNNKPSTGTTSKPSNSGNSTSKPSNNGSSSTNKPSSGTGGSSSTNKPSGNTSGGTTNKPDKEEKPKPHKHIFSVNTGKWFDTQAECVEYYDSVVAMWEDKLNNNIISYEEFGKKCPMGYEVFRCTCGKRGLNLSYAS